MTTDVEITWNFVDENESRQLAAFLIFDRLSCFINYLLDFIPTFMGFPILFGLLVSWYFSVSIIINVVNSVDLVAVLVKSDFL